MCYIMLLRHPANAKTQHLTGWVKASPPFPFPHPFPTHPGEAACVCTFKGMHCGGLLLLGWQAFIYGDRLALQKHVSAMALATLGMAGRSNRASENGYVQLSHVNPMPLRGTAAGWVPNCNNGMWGGKEVAASCIYFLRQDVRLGMGGDSKNYSCSTTSCSSLIY